MVSKGTHITIKVFLRNDVNKIECSFKHAKTTFRLFYPLFRKFIQKMEGDRVAKDITTTQLHSTIVTTNIAKGNFAGFYLLTPNVVSIRLFNREQVENFLTYLIALIKSEGVFEKITLENTIKDEKPGTLEFDFNKIGLSASQVQTIIGSKAE
ncbi:hypothetical protein ACFLQI_02005 [Candidatus Undinarchaeota archaeon]